MPEVVDRIAALFGLAVLPRDAGVVHVTALAAQPGSGEPAVTMAINEYTPRCELDTFSLNLARARADVILTTGQILRDEPTLTYDLFVPEPWASALQQWRVELLGRAEPPEVWILTSGRDLDLHHPSLHSWARPVIVTSTAAATTLAPAARALGLRVLGLEGVGPRAAVEAAVGAGARTVVIEAGPRTSTALYEAPLLVDELQLSVYAGVLDPRARAGDPWSLELLRSQLPVLAGSSVHGDWRFERWCRSPARDGAASPERRRSRSARSPRAR